MMEKTNWKFYFDRTGRSLSSFLKGVYDVQTAKNAFSKKGLTCPPDSDLEDQVAKNLAAKAERDRLEAEAKIPRAKPTVPRRKQSKPKQTKKKASPKKKAATSAPEAAADHEASTETDQKKTKNEKYFRRVIAPTSKKSS